MSDARAALDLRLVPAAVVCWLASGLAVGGRASYVALVGVIGAVAGSLGAVLHCRSRRRPGCTPGYREGARGAGRVGRPGRRRGGAGTVLVALAAATAALLSCAAQLHTRESGLMADLVADRSVVTVVGMIRAEVVALRARPGAEHDPATTAGGTGAEPEVERCRTVLAVDEVTGRGRRGPAATGLVVLGGPQWCDIAYGTRVRATGRLAPGGAGERVTASLTSWGDVEVVDGPGVVDAQVGILRQSLLAVTEPLPADLRGLVPGAAIGDTSRIPATLATAMRTVGLTHVTAVSGSHFAVLAVAVLTLTAWLRMPRAGRAATSVVVLAGFVLLVHPEASVVRAAVMGAVAAFALLLGRRSSPAPALAATVVALLVLDPWLARSYGFVLSVVATAAIVLLAPPVAERLSLALPRWLAVAVAVPTSAQLACAPVLVLLDPAVSLYAVPANLLAAPALVPATLLGLGATLTASWFPGLALVLAWGAGGAAWWVAAVARAGAAAPGARLDWPGGVPGVVALTALGAAVVVVVVGGPRLRRESRTALLVVVASVATVLLPGVHSWVLASLAG